MTVTGFPVGMALRASVLGLAFSRDRAGTTPGPTRPVRLIAALRPGAAIPTCWHASSPTSSARPSASPSSSRTCPGRRRPSSAANLVAKSPPGRSCADVSGDFRRARDQSGAQFPGLGLRPRSRISRPVTRAGDGLPTILSIPPGGAGEHASMSFIALRQEGARQDELRLGPAPESIQSSDLLRSSPSGAGIELLHVPYRGGSAMVNGPFLTGEIQGRLVRHPPTSSS